MSKVSTKKIAWITLGTVLSVPLILMGTQAIFDYSKNKKESEQKKQKEQWFETEVFPNNTLLIKETSKADNGTTKVNYFSSSLFKKDEKTLYFSQPVQRWANSLVIDEAVHQVLEKKFEYVIAKEADQKNINEIKWSHLRTINNVNEFYLNFLEQSYIDSFLWFEINASIFSYGIPIIIDKNSDIVNKCIDVSFEEYTGNINLYFSIKNDIVSFFSNPFNKSFNDILEQYKNQINYDFGTYDQWYYDKNKNINLSIAILGAKINSNYDNDIVDGAQTIMSQKGFMYLKWLKAYVDIEFSYCLPFHSNKNK